MICRSGLFILGKTKNLLKQYDMAIKHLSPKSKEEIITITEKSKLHPDLIFKMREDNENYDIILGYLMKRSGKFNKTIYDMNLITDLIKILNQQ